VSSYSEWSVTLRVKGEARISGYFLKPFRVNAWDRDEAITTAKRYARGDKLEVVGVDEVAEVVPKRGRR
jgi:hypothetical protein